MTDKPIMKPKRSDAGWFLCDPSGDVVVDEGGFAALFPSRRAAVEAIPRVRWNRQDQWWQID